MKDFFFVKQNDDGSYGEPIQAKNIELNLTTQGMGDPIPMPDFMGMEVSVQLDYKQMKNLAWVLILNLKLCRKRLVSKNIWEG